MVDKLLKPDLLTGPDQDISKGKNLDLIWTISLCLYVFTKNVTIICIRRYISTTP